MWPFVCFASVSWTILNIDVVGGWLNTLVGRLMNKIKTHRLIVYIRPARVRLCVASTSLNNAPANAVGVPQAPSGKPPSRLPIPTSHGRKWLAICAARYQGRLNVNCTALQGEIYLKDFRFDWQVLDNEE